MRKRAFRDPRPRTLARTSARIATNKDLRQGLSQDLDKDFCQKLGAREPLIGLSGREELIHVFVYHPLLPLSSKIAYLLENFIFGTSAL